MTVVATPASEQAQAGEDAEHSEGGATAGGTGTRRGAQAGGELGVLCVEGLLHLLEQTLFMLGERHD